MLRRRSLLRWLVPAFLVVLLALYALATGVSLMLSPSETGSKSLVEGYRLAWRNFNLNERTDSPNVNPKNGSLLNKLKAERSLASSKPTSSILGSLTLAPSTDSKEVRVLCWIMTSPSSLRPKATHVKQTWGPRCDVTLYMSTQADPEFPAIGLDVSEGRDNLWNKTRTAFRYVYRHHFQDADWFMKADDDTYVVVDNLRYFLRDKNSSAPLYYGHNFTPYVKQGYMSGGAGYVLSREALKRFAEADNYRCSKQDYKAEDVGMGFCMQSLDVIAGDSRDSLNRSRFLPLSLVDFVNNHLPDWYHKYRKYEIPQGPSCCSDYLISCHYMTSYDMHLLDFVVYHLRSANDNKRHVYKIGNNRTLPI
ncbi:glycoprotein-N-acetylgalactosamine 3-beta-galactosyltransferase 1-like [Patiria miniata]|uniref:Glycoprotein-N-acetylgalactosamine 3-beta-galactosyltransferase 1 n=1 Tax=Patiria miniata TaxID=46514 RepID=A0A913YZ99_PATMI|nr:glycoprotein-N-acetylgalactosamine 3-beta-galactosyltransferase 1-like [Patiria miniata]